jgi:superfamily II DNA helicase RecQ
MPERTRTGGEEKIGRRSVEFVFTTPEQLASGALHDVLAKAAVDLIVIDEAHCTSQWATTFDPPTWKRQGYFGNIGRRRSWRSPPRPRLKSSTTSALGEEITWSRCGTCDNCRGEATRAQATAEGAA